MALYGSDPRSIALLFMSRSEFEDAFTAAGRAKDDTERQARSDRTAAGEEALKEWLAQ